MPFSIIDNEDSLKDLLTSEDQNVRKDAYTYLKNQKTLNRRHEIKIRKIEKEEKVEVARIEQESAENVAKTNKQKELGKTILRWIAAPPITLIAISFIYPNLPSKGYHALLNGFNSIFLFSTPSNKNIPSIDTLTTNIPQSPVIIKNNTGGVNAISNQSKDPSIESNYNSLGDVNKTSNNQLPTRDSIVTDYTETVMLDTDNHQPISNELEPEHKINTKESKMISVAKERFIKMQADKFKSNLYVHNFSVTHIDKGLLKYKFDLKNRIPKPDIRIDSIEISTYLVRRLSNNRSDTLVIGLRGHSLDRESIEDEVVIDKTVNQFFRSQDSFAKRKLKKHPYKLLICYKGIQLGSEIIDETWY